METKPKKELTHDQIEELKARLLKAREAKLNKKRVLRLFLFMIYIYHI